MGWPMSIIRSWVRTGDTPQAERQRAAKLPPHIVVTTPESLYILLGSDSGRAMLKTTRAVIVDEIHAVASSKRGSHLSLSLERLSALCGGRLQRIGLSATQKPIEEVASFLVGAGADRQLPLIVDSGHYRARDLQLEVPPTPLEAVMSAEVWDQVYDRLAELIESHRTTLIFVNTRRMAERVTRKLSDRLGEVRIAAHHGSLAKEQRLDAEQRLKAVRSPPWWRPPRSSWASISATWIWYASSARRARSRPSFSASAALGTASAANRRAGCSLSPMTTSSNARR